MEKKLFFLREREHPFDYMLFYAESMEEVAKIHNRHFEVETDADSLEYIHEVYEIDMINAKRVRDILFEEE